jgi:hypothetical protein
MKKGYMKAAWIVRCSCESCGEFVIGEETCAALRAMLIRAGWREFITGWRCPDCLPQQANKKAG